MREEKPIKETELFERILFALLKKNKSQLEKVKSSASQLLNIRVNNSGLIRGIIEFYFENPKELLKVKKYIYQNMGFRILDELQEMIEKGATPSEVSATIGISEAKAAELVERLREKNQNK